MLLKELGYAFRILRNNPAFAAIAICSLAIGIGATSAIYSFADALLLRPLPVVEPSRVVTLMQSSTATFKATNSISYPDYLDLRDRNHTFEGLVATTYSSFGLAADRSTQPHMKYGMFVTGNFFQVMGIKPQQGRFFRTDEDQVSGKDPVVVLSPGLWASEFAANPGVCGRTLWLNGIEFTIVGVAPESFPGIGQLKPALYVPLAMAPSLLGKNDLTKRDARWLDVRGRLKPGIRIPQAAADVDSITYALRGMYGDTDRNLHLKVLTELQLRAERSPPDFALITMLSLLALCVLFVACANVTGLLLSRASIRSREISVRLAIGASRASLIRQLFLENLLLALAGGAAGLLVANLAIEFFGQIPLPTDVPFDLTFHLDQRALLFTLAAAISSTFIFGLTPAFATTRIDLMKGLKERSATAAGHHRLWGRNIIVAGQVALSIVLLIVSAVMLQGFRSQIDQGPGFRIQRIQTVTFDPTLMRYSEAQQKSFYDRLLDLTRQSSSVESAALASTVPMSMGGGVAVVPVVPQDLTLKPGEQDPSIFNAVVSPEYFRTMAIPIVQGRDFLKSDQPNTPQVAIVNEQFARHYWPNQNPIGKKIQLHADANKELQVVGVAKTTKYLWITEAPLDYLYLPFTQNPKPYMALVAQSKTQDAAALMPLLRQIVQSLDQNMPMFEVRTMKDLYETRAIVTSRILTQTVTLLGLMGLVLSVIGLYGVVSYSVSRRTREFGIRMALGADRSRVMQIVLKQSLLLGVAGLAVGAIAAIFVTRAITSLLLFAFPVGPAPFIWVAIALLLTIALAGYFPARRASLIDPMRCLREE